MQHPLEIVLASTSPYRKLLMERTGLPFVALKPQFDEEAGKLTFEREHPQGSPSDLALYLAEKKAQSLASPTRVVIGGDQLVSFEGEILGKPGDREKAIAQLMKMQGKTHELLTAVSVISPKTPTDTNYQVTNYLHRTVVVMRNLAEAEAAWSVDRDKSWDAAGAYKFEGAGVTLMDGLECSDPSAIEGLPLIELGKILRAVLGSHA